MGVAEEGQGWGNMTTCIIPDLLMILDDIYDLSRIDFYVVELVYGIYYIFSCNRPGNKFN